MHRVCLRVWKAIDIHAVSLCLPTCMFVFASNTLVHTQYIDYVHEAICDKCLSKASANCTMFYIRIPFYSFITFTNTSNQQELVQLDVQLGFEKTQIFIVKQAQSPIEGSGGALACKQTCSVPSHHVLVPANKQGWAGRSGREVVVGGGETPAVSQRIARQTSDLHQTDGVSVTLHVWHANCVRRQCGASSFGNVRSCTKQSCFLIRQHFHTTDGLCDLQRLRRSFCLPCASPLLFKRGNMFSLFVSSSGSPRMGEMMRSTGGAEDEGGQAATEMTLADSEMRVKLFCVHKYVTQLPLFFIYFYYLAGVCTHRPLYEVDNQAIMWRRVSAFGHV